MIEFIFSVKFFPCLLIATLLFAAYLPRRNFFVLRFITCFLVSAALSALLWRLCKNSAFLPFIPKFKFVLCNFVFFFEAVGVICLCFDCTFFQAALYVCCGWCVEHISKSAATLAALLLKVEGIMYDYSAEYFIITVLSYLIFYCAVFIIFFNMHKDSRINLDKKKLIIPTLILLLTVVIIEIYLPTEVYNQSDVMAVVKLYALACCISCLTLMFNIFETGRYKRELALMEQFDRKRREQYEVSRQSIEVINLKCHDLKKMLDSGLKARGVMTDEEVTKLKEQISIYDSIIATGNDALDLVLTEKSLYCENNGIKLTVMADGQNLGFLTDMDIYSLFGNILDNAVEAVMKVEREKRIITLNVKRASGILSVHEENYFDGRLNYSGRDIDTVKTDKYNHGFGLMSIRRVAEKFGGGVTVCADGEIFKLDAVIPVPAL